MEKMSLTALVRHQLSLAQNASSGRSAHTVYGGHEHVLRQTMIAMMAGQMLNAHENQEKPPCTSCTAAFGSPQETRPGKARPGTCSSCRTPQTREALETAAVLLTVGKHR